MSKVIEYCDVGLIENDLKRLKKLVSLKEDIKNTCNIIIGKTTDNIILNSCPPKTIFGDLITKKTLEDKDFHFYKKRVPITNPKTSPSEGCRLIYGICVYKLIPFFVYKAPEEKAHYEINNKKIPIQKAGLIKIIEEKIKILK